MSMILKHLYINTGLYFLRLYFIAQLHLLHVFSYLLNSSDFLTGFDTEGLGPAVFHGGEAEALTRLERHLERKVKNC